MSEDSSTDSEPCNTITRKLQDSVQELVRPLKVTNLAVDSES